MIWKKASVGAVSRSRYELVNALAIVALISMASSGLARAEERYVFCDLKRNLAGREDPLSNSNFRAVIDAFRSQIGCNGIRVYIDPLTSAAKMADVASEPREGYTSLYRDTFRYARSKNMKIYANLLPLPNELEFSGNAEKWSATVTAYANYFCPDYIGPFNENEKFRAHVQVVSALRKNLKRSCVDPFGNEVKTIQIVGPDSSSTRALLQTMKREPELAGLLDVLGAHNNKGGKNTANASGTADRSATAEDWRRIASRYNKPVWASEVASEWSNTPFAGKNRGQNVGLQAVIESGDVDGAVIYMATNLFEMNALELNAKGKAIAAGLRSAGWVSP